MKKKKKKQVPEDQDPQTEAAQEKTACEAPAEEGSPPELTPEERIAELEGLLQRSRADFANLRRRGLADSDLAVARAETAMLREMLTLADWLEMALVAEATSPDAITLKEGVRLTRDQLTGLLSNLGVKEISTKGSFNPDEHQAVATVDDEELEPGTIASVIRKGFLRKTEVLRHAQVKVVAQPDSEEAQQDQSEGEDEPQPDSDASPARDRA